MKYNHAALKKQKKTALSTVNSKSLLKPDKNKKKVNFKKSEGDVLETEVLLSQVSLKNDSNCTIDPKLETIKEESVETLTEEEEDQFERNTSELISLIEVEKEYLSRSIEEYFFDLTSSTAEEDLKLLQMTLFKGKKNQDFVDETEPQNMEENLSPASFEELKVGPVAAVPNDEISPADDNLLEPNKETMTVLAPKTSSTLTFVISNVLLEGKPSSTNISVTGITSNSSVSSYTASQPEVKLSDFIAEMSPPPVFNVVQANKTYDLTSDLSALCCYLFEQISRFFHSPLAIYFVIFAGSVYITLSSVFYDTLNGAELVWNIFPGNRRSFPGCFLKKAIFRYFSLKL